jgi:hypothetical protein
MGEFAIVYGLDRIATVRPIVKLTGKTFGKERAPLIFGWMSTGHQIGAAIAVIPVRRPAAEIQPHVA